MKSYTELKKDLDRINEEYDTEDKYNKELDKWNIGLELFIKSKYPEVHRQIYNQIYGAYTKLDFSDEFDAISSEKRFIKDLISFYIDDLSKFYNIDLDKCFNDYFNSKQ